MIGSGYPDEWLKTVQIARSTGLILLPLWQEEAERAKLQVFLKQSLANEQAYQKAVVPSAPKASDPDGPLVPLSTTKPQILPRAFTAVKHDFIAALYRPYEPPV